MFDFNMTEDSANVQDVPERAQEVFAENGLVLVQANGLRIEDNAVTRGNDKHKTNTYTLFLSLLKQNEICLSCSLFLL